MEVGPGTLIAGKYRLVETIGAGAMGAVWHAVQLGLERSVAVKLLHPRFGTRVEARARFEREARVAAALDHPASVAILDFGDHDGMPYLVMELLVGETLRDRLERGPVSRADALAIVAQIAGALAAAHRLSLVHRDLKPENTFLETTDAPVPQVKVVDFGLAFIAAPDLERAGLGRLTDEGVLGGTPAYMSPEQIRGRSIGPASDVYALGCMLHELIAGQPPFAGGLGEMLTRQSYAPPPSLRELEGIAPVSPALEQLVLSMLAKSAPLRPSPTRVVEAIAALVEAGDGPRVGRTGAVATDRQARMLARPDAPAAPDDIATVTVLGPLDDQLMLALAAGGLTAQVRAAETIGAGALVWAPGAELAVLARLAGRGAIVLTDAPAGDVGRLVELVRIGVAEAVVQPVRADELGHRLRRAYRHRGAGLVA